MASRTPGAVSPSTASATGASAGGSSLVGIGPADRPAQHPGDEAVLGLLGRRGRPHDATVAQDRDGVRELQDLGQEMRDEDDRPAPLPQAADDLVESRRLGRREARRRLVEDDQVRLARERAQDLHLLLLRQRQVPHDRVRSQVEAGLLDQPVEPFPERPTVDEAGASRLDAEEHVLGHGQPRDERDLLGDERDPADERLARGAERHRRPPQHQVALVLREDAGDDLAQRGLAGAVLADERVDRAGPDGDRDIVESARRPEGLAERARLEMDGRVRRAGHGVSRSRSASARPLREREEGIHVGRGHDATVRAASRADRHRVPACRTGWHRSGPSCPGRLRSRASA